MEGGRREGSDGRRCDCGRKSQRDVTLLALKMEEWAKIKECGRCLAAGKGKEINSPLERPEGTQSC